MTAFDTFLELHRGFRKLGLEPPVAIILKDWSQGMAFANQLLADQSYRHVMPSLPDTRLIEHPDGSIWHEFIVADIKVHWPANKRATESGFEWI